MSQVFIERCGEAVVHSLPSAIGVYLHGSAAMNDFVQGVSDVDICGVMSDANFPNELGGLEERMSPTAFVVEDGGFDVDVVSAAAASTGSGTPVRELGLSRHGPDWRVFRNDSDPNLCLVFEMCRRHGQALHGPPPDQVFAPQKKTHLLAASASELRSWLAHDPINDWASAVLSACRATWLVETGELGSKTAAGRWAAERGVPLVDRALSRRHGVVEAADQVKVREILKSALGSIERTLG